MSKGQLDSRALAQARTMSRYRDVILSPVVSEKSYERHNDSIYTFVVDISANKIEIRQAIETLFNVTVTNVRTLNREGKRKRNRKTGVWGKSPDKKIAIVSLKEGDTIEVVGA